MMDPVPLAQVTSLEIGYIQTTKCDLPHVSHDNVQKVHPRSKSNATEMNNSSDRLCALIIAAIHTYIYICV